MTGFTITAEVTGSIGIVVEPVQRWPASNDPTGASALRPSLANEGVPIFARTPVQLDPEASDGKRLVAPPPETVVVGSWRQAIDAEEQTRAREMVLREEHAVEVARLTQAIRDIKKDHAAEIERLRSEHSAESRRLVEALWQAQDAARDALDSVGGRKESATPEAEARSWLDCIVAYEWWASLIIRFK